MSSKHSRSAATGAFVENPQDYDVVVNLPTMNWLESVVVRTSLLDIAASSSRLRHLRTIAYYAIVLLFAKVLVGILIEYRFYFPADFDSAFLTGRKATFAGLYRMAFYAHIIASPVAFVIAALLMVSGGVKKYTHVHRWAGRVQAVVVVGVVVPSGIVMARQALAGQIAGAGFVCLSIATGICMIVAVIHAWRRRFVTHKRWATRCFILLLSPLILRLFSGTVIVVGAESDWFYRLNAWSSWLLPLVAYEIWWRYSIEERTPAILEHQLPTSDQT